MTQFVSIFYLLLHLSIAGPHHACTSEASKKFPFCNNALSISDRANDLLSRLTTEEKINLTWISGCTSADPDDGGIPRLGIPGYNWGTELLHGAAGACSGEHCPTIFPVLVNVASSFNFSAWKMMGDVIGTEMRALNNAGVGRSNCPNSVVGINGWGPNINLVRDPRWGRNIEVPSEDPYLSGQIGVALIQGIQGPVDHKYVKILASIKHFAVYSLEHSDMIDRKGFDPNISLRDLGESYLPGFQAAIEDGNVLGMMCSYTSMNGTAFCESAEWIQEWARRKHGFQGNVVSDCGALNMEGPESDMDVAQNAAAGLIAGTDLNCGKPWAYKNISQALHRSLIDVSYLNDAVLRSLVLRFKAGLFDPIENQEYTHIGTDQLGSEDHKQLAYEIATQGIVLLHNPGEILPLSRSESIALIGPHGNSTQALLGSYFDMACPQGDFKCVETPYEAMLRYSQDVTFDMGCNEVKCESLPGLANAIQAASRADHIVLLLGSDQNWEGEGNDRSNTSLPGLQNILASALLSLNKPTTLVLINGGIVSIDEIMRPNLAVLEAWYPGIMGSLAIADALFGITNRFGKLPVTIYKSSFSSQIKMSDMRIAGKRTYKYWGGDPPLYEFGFGLSYTSFSMAFKAFPKITTFKLLSDFVSVSISLTNSGSREGDEVIMVFVVPKKFENSHIAPNPLPKRILVDFSRHSLEAGQSKQVKFILTARMLSLVDSSGDRYVYPGDYTILFDRGNGTKLKMTITVDTMGPLIVEKLLRN